MKIAPKHVVSIHYTLTDDAGKVIDTSEGQEPLEYLHGAQNIVSGLEDALTGKKVGDELNVSVPPEKGYGVVRPELRKVLERSMFEGAPELEEGLQFQGETEHGTHIYTVVSIEGDQITVDGNHPLAGMTLNFGVEVVEVRKATPEELDHGHVHGPHGHHH